MKVRLYRCRKLMSRSIRIDRASSNRRRICHCADRQSLAIDAFAIDRPAVFRVPSVSGDQSTVQSFLIDGIYPRPGCCIRCWFYVLPRATDTHYQHARRALNYAYPCQTRRYGIAGKPLKTADNAVVRRFFLIRRHGSNRGIR